jgi:hypothetical protein
MFWNLFSSERRVQEALDQSVGYDISPNVIKPEPVRAARHPDPVTPGFWSDYAFTMPANTQDTAPRIEDMRERKKA